MSTLVQRLLIFFVGIPLVIGLLCLNQLNHIALHFLILMIVSLSTNELHNILSKSFNLQPKPFVIFVAIIPAIIGILCAIFNLDLYFIYIAFILSILFILGFEVLTAKKFEDSNAHILTSCFTVVYTGFLITYISRITFIQYSTQIIATFLLMVFMCDSLAWLFGSLFGKNNKGFIKASPNKSIAGFLGGILGSILSGILCYKIWPFIFVGSIFKIILLGFVISISSIIGDLVESVIKRSSECKDSGFLIPGRGGILDSIDSIIFSAPIYYIAIRYLYGFYA